MPVEEFFDVISEVHCREKGHIGSKKTVTEVRKILVMAELLYIRISHATDRQNIRVCTTVCYRQVCGAVFGMPYEKTTEHKRPIEANHLIWIHDERAGTSYCTYVVQFVNWQTVPLGRLDRYETST